MLYKYFRRVNKDEDDKKLPVLPVPKAIKMADEAVAKAMELSKSTDRGKYNTLWVTCSSIPGVGGIFFPYFGPFSVTPFQL